MYSGSLNGSRIKVSVETPPPEGRCSSCFSRSWRKLRLLPQRLFNIWQVAVRHQEILAPIRRSFHGDPRLWEFPTNENWHCTADPNVMKALQKHYRNESDREGGFYNIGRASQGFIDLFTDVFPTANPDKDVLIACQSEYVDKLRQAILDHIGPKKISDHKEVIREITKRLHQWIAARDQSVDIQEMSGILTAMVISQIALNKELDPDEAQELATIVMSLERYAMIRANSPVPQGTTADELYQRQCTEMRDRLTETLKDNDCPLLDVFDSYELEEMQQLCTLLIIYLGGVSTTRTAVSYTLWKLGQQNETQQEIREELERNGDSPKLRAFFYEVLRIFPPAYVQARYMAQPVTLRFETEAGEITTRHLREGDGIFVCPFMAGRDPVHFPNPDQFDPERFTGEETSLPNLPFGRGKHGCPGKWLAKAEVELALEELIRNYEITSSPGEIDYIGFVSLQITTPIQANLEPIEK